MQRSASTKRGYDNDWRQFNFWLDGREADVESVCDYLRDRHPELSANTLQRHLSAIKWDFTSRDEGSPTDHPQVKQAMREIERHDRYRVRRQSTPIDYALMLTLVAAVEGYTNTPKRLRDKAVLLVGWWGRLERCALVALNVGDVKPQSKAKVRLWLTHGRLSGPVLVDRDRGQLDVLDAVEAWKGYADIKDGPLFRRVDRHGNILASAIGAPSITQIVKDAVEAAGVDPLMYSSFSLTQGPNGAS